MNVSVSLNVEPSSLSAPSLKLVGFVSSEVEEVVEIRFGGGFGDAEGWSVSDLRTKMGDATASERAIITKGPTEFQGTLIASAKYPKALVPVGGRFVRLLGGVYPFRATEMEIDACATSKENDIHLSLNLRLPSGLVAYARIFKGVRSHFLDGEQRKSVLAYSTWEQSRNNVKVELGITYRFKPFVAFRMAVLPVAIIYAVALLTVGISMTGISIYGGFALARLALLAANATLFATVAEIPTGMGTRSLMGELKVAAWAFIALTVLQVTYPDLLRLLGFNIFDLVLKATDLWIAAAAIISTLIYPFVSEQRKLDSSVQFFVFGVAILAIARFYLTPPIPLAEALYHLQL